MKLRYTQLLDIQALLTHGGCTVTVLDPENDGVDVLEVVDVQGTHHEIFVHTYVYPAGEKANAA